MTNSRKNYEEDQEGFQCEKKFGVNFMLGPNQLPM